MPSVDVVVGAQRGDEGKGRITDLLAPDYHIIARGNGGANAGHTVSVKGMQSIALHQIPSGIIHKGKLNIIGNGCFVDPLALADEIEDVSKSGIEITPNNLIISDSAHLVLPHHVLLDRKRESGKKAQGSTKSGIAFIARDKALREGLRTEEIIEKSDGELLSIVAAKLKSALGNSEAALNHHIKLAKAWVEAAKELAPFLNDTAQIINSSLDQGKKVLAEGAQGHWLDINHGMYPMVTSSSTTAGGILEGLGIPPNKIGKVIGVVKAIKSHVGEGPFVTEITDKNLADTIRGNARDIDSEYGSTTGRARRIGFFDLVELRRAIQASGITEIALTKLDQVGRYGKTTKIATEYELNGESINLAPASALKLSQCRPKYQTIKTWEEDISNIREYKDLPTEAQAFVKIVEKALDTPIRTIGVGPERNQVITK